MNTTENSNLFKKWIKSVLIGESSDRTFQSGDIKARYDFDREVIIMLPDGKIFSRELISDAFYYDNKYNALIAKMLS